MGLRIVEDSRISGKFPVIFCWIFLEISVKFWFRKLREVCRKNSHQVAPLKTVMARFYGQTNKKVNEYLINEY